MRAIRHVRVTPLVPILVLGLAACTGDDDGDGESKSSEEQGDVEEEDTSNEERELASAGNQLGAWPEEAAQLLPVPDVLDISTASPNEDNPAFRGSSDNHPVDEVAADIDALMDELGWEVTQRGEDGAWLTWEAEHDEWTANITIKDKDGAGTFTEGGLSRIK